MSLEDRNHKKHSIIINKKEIKDVDFDVDMGMFFSNLVTFFIILTTGTVLFNAGVNNIDTVEQAALALKPLAGQFSYLLFAIGIIGTGFLAIPVLAGALSYSLAEFFGWDEGMDKKLHQAKGFYITIIISLVLGLFIELIGFSPIKALIYSAIVYGLIAPVLIAMILHICNNRKIMGMYVNDKISNFLGMAALLLMSFAAIVFIVQTII
jgi:Mn2+/Fe2+ NRAMP family transporter